VDEVEDVVDFVDVVVVEMIEWKGERRGRIDIDQTTGEKIDIDQRLEGRTEERIEDHMDDHRYPIVGMHQFENGIETSRNTTNTKDIKSIYFLNMVVGFTWV
jgi:hypothetical protein